MTDLVTFLRTRLDDDEQIARAALNPKRPGDWEWRKDSRTTVTVGGDPIQPSPGVERGPHIARWHPARVLAEVAAKRRILDDMAAWKHAVIDDCWYTCRAATEERDGGESCDESEGSGGPCTCGLDKRRDAIARLLALPFASHPDYDETWRPA